MSGEIERQAKDGTFYKQVGDDQWSPVTRTAKNGITYKKVGPDNWSPIDTETKAPKAVKGEGFIRGALQALPTAGAIAGGTMGLASPIPGGAFVGSGLGAAAGKALENFGEKLLGDEKTYTEAAADPVVAGIEGVTAEMGGQAVAPILSKGAKYISRGARDVAEKLASRRLGAERGSINKLGAKNVQEAGAYALDNELFGPLSSTDDIIKRNNEIKTSAMNARKSAYAEIDDAKASLFNPLDVATKVERKVVGNLDRSYDDTKELISKLEPEINNILSRGDGNISMSKAQELVANLGKKAKFDSSRSNEANQLAQDVYFTVRDAINESAEKASSSVNLGDAVRRANRTFSSGKTAETLLNNKQAAEKGNKILGLTDWGVISTSVPAAIATGGGSIVPSLAILGAKKGLEKYGAQNAALAFNKVSKLLTQTPEMAQLAQTNPAAFKAVVTNLLPQFESKTLEAIPKAAEERPQKGPERWVNDGIETLNQAGVPMEQLEQLKTTQKGRALLMDAQGAKPGSKRLESVLQRIRTASGGQ